MTSSTSLIISAPTEVQRRAWPAIQRRENVLLAAPTGSGKTLAAFLAAIDALVREGEAFGLPDETRVLYVSPLKALSNDIHKNLEEPLSGIKEQLGVLSPLEIRAAVRTGDTSQAERARMRKKPPHILVTTPESLYLLLTSESGRDMLSTVSTVIVDELHAVAIMLRRLTVFESRRLAKYLGDDPEVITALDVLSDARPTLRVKVTYGQAPRRQAVHDPLLGPRG